VYQNESGIGEAISKIPIERNKFFITTKMWPGMIGDETFQDFKGAMAWLECADQALYYAKDNGRDRVCDFSSLSSTPHSSN
jgi:diketogulonate reductase-like aldo/keto reductase